MCKRGIHYIYVRVTKVIVGIKLLGGLNLDIGCSEETQSLSVYVNGGILQGEPIRYP